MASDFDVIVIGGGGGRRARPDATALAQAGQRFYRAGMEGILIVMRLYRSGIPQMDRAIELQDAYWTADPQARRALLQRPRHELTWAELLRLHHLSLLTLIAGPAGQAQLRSGRILPAAAPAGADRDLCLELLDRLRSVRSPYRHRVCAVWHGAEGSAERPEADRQGRLGNASVTHLGALEVVHLDAAQQPERLSFVALDELSGVRFGPPSLLRAARLYYEDERGEEIVLVPLVYGLSWRSRQTHDRDGRMTRFICDLGSPGAGVGIGQQELQISDESGGIFGLASVCELMVALGLSDPRFEAKCRARGLDPEEVRRRAEPD